jgi:uncharacterized protein with PIN domain/endonuclease/exonuclease/phosphatase family metal-dependent hydrolase
MKKRTKKKNASSSGHHRKNKGTTTTTIHRAAGALDIDDPSHSSSWVHRIRFLESSSPPLLSNRPDNHNHDKNSSYSISILSWNVLAEAYCSRHSQCGLPKQYQARVFHKSLRKHAVCDTLKRICCKTKSNQDSNVVVVAGGFDIVCLQEVDIPEIAKTMMHDDDDDDEWRYATVLETPRTMRGGGAGGRIDACAMYIRHHKLSSVSLPTTASTTNLLVDQRQPSIQLVNYEIVRFDDLATLSSSSPTGGGLSSNIQGIQQSFLRRNMAIIARLRLSHPNSSTNSRTIIVANAHLFWNPEFEYVKLCQAHYLMQRIEQFRQNHHHHPNPEDDNGSNSSTAPATNLYMADAVLPPKEEEPVILAGDWNSRPHGITYTYLTQGYINAKWVAPWYADTRMTTTTTDAGSDPKECENIHDKIHDETTMANELKNLRLQDPDNNSTHQKSSSEKNETPRMRYLLDASLNKMTRWLRILGIDTALETAEEEQLRTSSKGEIIIFDRCRQERRTLVTTSPKLMRRRDCPASAYCIHPPYLSQLEVALVHLLLTHGVVLDPNTFLARCVVCNGNILEVSDDDEKRHILNEYDAPSDLIDDGMEVYRCDGCAQGYWWNDNPTSSASRVKTAATRLFELCVRGGVPVREEIPVDHMFHHVDVEKLRQEGWDPNEPGGDMLQQRLDVIEWLKNEHLECPLPLESTYARKVSKDGCDTWCVDGETLPFTNVTADFVDTLDYIFFDRRYARVTERLYVPTSFAELNDGRTFANAHLLPSDVWPSDHLAIGARIEFKPSMDVADANNVEHDSEDKKNITQETIDSLEYCISANGTEDVSSLPLFSSTHGPRCSCGCVPNIPSLFEMAEMRKQAKLKSVVNR